MLTKTTEAGLQALTYLALRDNAEPVSPRAIAAELGLSSTYLAKIAAQLVKAGILRARRGVKGGVALSCPPRAVTLLDIVQALQGRIVGGYCDSPPARARVCAFHAAMQEVHHATIEILQRWTLADLAQRPVGRRAPACLMRCLEPAARRR